MGIASHLRPHKLCSHWQSLWEQIGSQSTLIRWAAAGAATYVLYQALLFLVYDSGAVWFLPAKETSGDVVLFTHGDTRFLIATLAVAALTLVVHFALNEYWAFRDRPAVSERLWIRFGQFVATVLVSAGIVTLTVNVLKVRFDMYHFVALPIGVLLGGVWNWLWASRFIWRAEREI